MSLELLVLGSGTSAGVPMIGCECSVCTSADPRDRRTRPSVLVSYPDPTHPKHKRQLLIDTGPDLRDQIIRNRIHHIDGVLFTHAHADHIFGLDDVRRFNAVMKQPIDIYAEPDTMRIIRQVFFYIFERHLNINDSFVANLVCRELTVEVSFDLFGVRWTPLRLMHGRLPILGFRVDWTASDSTTTASLAYCTDVSAIPPETYPLLADLDLLVIDGLRYRHHPTHLSIDQALDQIDQIQPRRALLTHLAHDVEHADLDPRLPRGVSLAYDGLRVVCDGVTVTTVPAAGLPAGS